MRAAGHSVWIVRVATHSVWSIAAAANTLEGTSDLPGVKETYLDVSVVISACVCIKTTVYVGQLSNIRRNVTEYVTLRSPNIWFTKVKDDSILLQHSSKFEKRTLSVLSLLWAKTGLCWKWTNGMMNVLQRYFNAIDITYHATTGYGSQS